MEIVYDFHDKPERDILKEKQFILAAMVRIRIHGNILPAVLKLLGLNGICKNKCRISKHGFHHLPNRPHRHPNRRSSHSFYKSSMSAYDLLAKADLLLQHPQEIILREKR